MVDFSTRAKELDIIKEWFILYINIDVELFGMLVCVGAIVIDKQSVA